MTFLTGTSGIALIQGVDVVPTSGEGSVEILKIAIQLIIGIITIFKLVKKPKETPKN